MVRENAYVSRKDFSLGWKKRKEEGQYFCLVRLISKQRYAEME
jgi:hypothetical protein